MAAAERRCGSRMMVALTPGARPLGDNEAELGIGDDHRRGEQPAQVTRSSICWKVDDVPITVLARHRPQPRAGTAAQYHRDNKLLRHAAIPYV
jgi:hypothetical protein